MKNIIGIPSNGPELSDYISEHFGHCNYFVGIEIDDDMNYKKIFSLRNTGHSGCMEPVINMKHRNITEMIVGGIGGRPYMGFIELNIPIYQGVYGTLKDNVELFIRGELQSLQGSSCAGGQSIHHH